jgi:hypothetical protein
MSLPRLNFVVTIDAEEDNWGFECHKSSVKNIKMIPRLQDLFDRYGIKPSYMVSYPVASCDWVVDIFSDILSKDKCEIGAHLHPWNTPPIREIICERNSMMKNLPYKLQVEKINVLTEKLEKVFGKKPRSFRAGRWGLGQDTIKALIECGYMVDSSVTPTISWRRSGEGPEYPDVENEPYWMTVDGEQHNQNSNRLILEVPATIGFNRWPFEFWQQIHLKMQKGWLKSIKSVAIMHHTGLLRKIWLSPEISSAANMIALSKTMIRNGIQFLNLSFHSTTLLPGKTPFVKNNIDLEDFYSRLEKLLDYLKKHTNLNSLMLSDVKKLFHAGIE